MTTSTPSAAPPNADLNRLFDPALEPETVVDLDAEEFHAQFEKPVRLLPISLANATAEQTALIFGTDVSNTPVQSTIFMPNGSSPVDLPKKDQPLNKGVAYVPNAQVWDDSTRSWQ